MACIAGAPLGTVLLRARRLAAMGPRVTPGGCCCCCFSGAMNFEIELCSSAKPSSTLPTVLSIDIRPGPSVPGEDTTTEAPVRDVPALPALSRAALLLRLGGGMTSLSFRAGSSAPECATIHFKPFISRSRRSLSRSSSSTLCTSSARSSAWRSVRLRRYDERRLYLSTCCCSASRKSCALAFSSASTLRARSSRIGVRGDERPEVSRSSVSVSEPRTGEDGTLRLTLASESGDMLPCARATMEAGATSLGGTTGGRVRRGLRGEDGDGGPLREESDVVGVGRFSVALTGGEGRGSLGGPVVGGVCQVRFSGGGSVLFPVPAPCWAGGL